VNTEVVKNDWRVAHPARMTRRAWPAGPRRAAAFSLIELMTVITVIGVMMALGAPSYKYITNSNRVSTEINGLLGDMMLARSEAIKEGINVSVCPSSNGSACTLSGTTWQTGWIVFTDLNANGAVDGTDMVLRVQKPFTSTDTLTPDDAAVTFVTFNREGFATGLPTATSGVNFVVRTAPANSAYLRCLNVVFVGMLSTNRASLNGCPSS
jgi:type IV fimbrial biogenesis protein FimT